MLREKLELVTSRWRRAGRALWTHPRFARLYPELLFRNHCMIRASVPLMESALQRATTLAPEDRVADGLAEYFARHIPEERHHDDWLLDDLEVLGVARARVLERVPSPTIAALVGAQYYWIRHDHPVALLGYIAVLEGTPPTVAHLESVIARSGLPRRAFRTFLKHATLDVHHRGDLDRFVDRLPLRRRHQALIGVSAIRTVHLLEDSLSELLDAVA